MQGSEGRDLGNSIGERIKRKKINQVEEDYWQSTGEKVKMGKREKGNRKKRCT